MMTLLTLETRGFCLALRVLCRVFISWELLPPRFFTVNFNGSVTGTHDGASFIICGSGLGLLATGGHYLFEPTVLVAELQGAWADIVYDPKNLIDRPHHH